MADIPKRPEPPKSRKVIEGSLIPLWVKVITVLIFCFFIGAGIIFKTIGWEKFRDKFLEPFTVEIPVPIEKKVEVEKIKWVEHIKIPTYTMIEHLKPSVDPDVAKKIGSAVDTYSKEYQLPKKLIMSIMFHESSFDLNARSKAGAVGLMQVLPKYHQDKIDEMGINDKRKLYHINNNINLGCKIWRAYYDASDKDLDETFHRYLSKNASEDQKNAYKNKILETWARLEFLEFQYENGYNQHKPVKERH